MCDVLGGPLSLGAFKTSLREGWDRVRDKCVGSCSNGSGSGVDCDINTGDCILPEHLRGGSLPGNRSSVVSSVSKPSSGTLVSLAGLLGTQSLPLGGAHQTGQQATDDSTGTPGARLKKRVAPVYPVVRILDPLMVYDNINLGRRIDPVWPDPEWRAQGGRNAWGAWIPREDMKGIVLHRWTPMHPHPMYRSHTDKTILLVKMMDKYVPIAEHAVEMVFQDQGPEGGGQPSPAPRNRAESHSAQHKSSRSKSTPERSHEGRGEYTRRTKEGTLGVRILDPLLDEEASEAPAEQPDNNKSERLELKKVVIFFIFPLLFCI